MLGEREAIATIAVRNVTTAKAFYEGKLGLKPARSPEPSVLLYGNRHSKVLVYQSQYAGTNRATAATWVVGDGIEEVVRELREKGIAFEHYDILGMTRTGDVHGDGRTRTAWFKDPDGNILALVSG